MGTGGCFPGVKRPGREADHSPPSIAEVTNAWNYASTLEHVFMVWCLIKHRDKFALLSSSSSSSSSILNLFFS